ncbi:MAG: hypothetical protein ACR2KV_08045 [Solirubrobacteraceae bacterium]
MAAEQAAADCTAYIEAIIALRRETEPPGSGWDGEGGRAGSLRARLNDLAEHRRRQVTALREHASAVNEHTGAALTHTQIAARHADAAADARRELYRLMATLAELTREAESPRAPRDVAAPNGEQRAGSTETRTPPRPA